MTRPDGQLRNGDTETVGFRNHIVVARQLCTHDTPETEIACEWLALELSAHSLLPILECIKIDHFNDANIVAINALLLTVWKKRKSLTL